MSYFYCVEFLLSTTVLGPYSDSKPPFMVRQHSQRSRPPRWKIRLPLDCSSSIVIYDRNIATFQQPQLSLSAKAFMHTHTFLTLLLVVSLFGMMTAGTIELERWRRWSFILMIRLQSINRTFSVVGNINQDFCPKHKCLTRSSTSAVTQARLFSELGTSSIVVTRAKPSPTVSKNGQKGFLRGIIRFGSQ